MKIDGVDAGVLLTSQIREAIDHLARRMAEISRRFQSVDLLELQN